MYEMKTMGGNNDGVLTMFTKTINVNHPISFAIKFPTLNIYIKNAVSHNRFIPCTENEELKLQFVLTFELGPALVNELKLE